MEEGKTSNKKKEEAVIDGRVSFRYSGSKCLVYCQRMHHVSFYRTKGRASYRSS
jgi:hypothetical protein